MMKRKNISKRLTHDELKIIGKQLLQARGFNELEIEEEYTIHVANGKHYRIDIAAVRNGKVLVAIECGQLKHEKAVILSEISGELVHIPYHYKPVDNVSLEIIALKEDNERLRQTLNEYSINKQTEKILSKDSSKYSLNETKTEKPKFLTKLDELTKKVEEQATSGIPGFYRVINTLIAEIAEERGEDPEEFKQSLLAKIREENESQDIHVITRQGDCEAEEER